MLTNLPQHVDVAIVGAGPAGLATACSLRQDGIKAVVLDAAHEPSPFSKASILHSRTLEVLEDIGVTQTLLGLGVVITSFNAWSRKAWLTRLEFTRMDTKYPLTLGLPQSVTEKVLLERLAELGGTVVRDATVTALASNCDDTLLEITGSAGSKSYLSAKYVVAADGVHSSIRKMLHIPFEGGDYSASMIAADVKLRTAGTFSLVPDEACICFGKDNFALFMAITPDVWRLLMPLENAPKSPTKDQIQTWVDERTPPGTAQIKELLWSDRFRTHHRQASRYRSGRVFLVGDAAHSFSPAGGQGMNAGIQDGLAVATVLKAAVIDDEDSEAALDRYERVRRPIAKGIIQMTHRLTVVGQWKSAWAKWARDWFIGVFMQVAGVEAGVTKRLAAFGA
ncbi:hypothetical protein KC365_g16605 [Hortaea werneckii]|nr:hypothetical protein KC365_g16605 [Hortaea werneckii]